MIDEVRAGRLTRVAAAQALDMTLDDFLAEAGRHGLDEIDYDVDDFKRELDTIAAPPAELPPFELVTFGAGGRFSTQDVDKTSVLTEADDIERRHG